MEEMQISRPQWELKVDTWPILRPGSDLRVGAQGTLSKRPEQQVSTEVHELAD